MVNRTVYDARDRVEEFDDAGRRLFVASLRHEARNGRFRRSVRWVVTAVPPLFFLLLLPYAVPSSSTKTRKINFIIPKKFLKILWISLTNSSNFLVICILNRKTRWFSKTWVKLNWNWLYHWHLSTCKRMSIWWTKGPMLSGGASAVIHYTPAAVLEPLTMSPRDAPSVHSPLHLPSTSFLNSHITKSVAAYSFSLASNNQFFS